MAAPDTLRPVEWHVVDTAHQPVCPCCARRANLPMLFGPDCPARIRKRPGLGGRGPTNPSPGWVHLTYRHRACGQILEIALRVAPLPDPAVTR